MESRKTSGSSWRLSIIFSHDHRLTMSTKAYYQKQIIDLRARMAREKEAMKRDNESYARMIANASSPTSKASYRKSKVDRAESHKRNIESIKRQIAQAQLNKTRAPK